MYFCLMGKSTGGSRSLHLHLSCRQMVWIIIWRLRKTDMPTTTRRDVMMEWKGPGAGHGGGTRYRGDANLQITTWVLSWEKERTRRFFDIEQSFSASHAFTHLTQKNLITCSRAYRGPLNTLLLTYCCLLINESFLLNDSFKWIDLTIWD